MLLPRSAIAAIIGAATRALTRQRARYAIRQITMA